MVGVGRNLLLLWEKAWDCSRKEEGGLCGLPDLHPPSHYQQLDARGLYNQQVPSVREIKTYTHSVAVESDRKEIYICATAWNV
jgi:hypothetical protein